MPPHGRLIPLAAVAIAFGLAPPAHAAITGHREDATRVTYTGDGASDRVSLHGNTPSWYLSTLQGADPVTFMPSPGCSASTQLVCGAASVARLRLGAGNDEVAFSGDGATFDFAGEDGGDRVTTNFNWSGTLLGGPGEDELLAGSYGADTIDGGPGNDTLGHLLGGDVVAGGDGVDTVVAIGSSPYVMTLDGSANDGMANQASANIGADVENLAGGGGADELAGDANANTLNGKAGDDFLDGGAGSDTLIGEAGNDRVMTRDGAPDAIDCGLGSDTVTADRADTVAPNCESVSLPPADPGPDPGPGPGPDPGPDPEPEPDPGRGGEPRPGGGSGRARSIESPVSNRWAYAKRFTKLLALSVRALPVRARVEVRCRGKGCAFARRSVRVRGGKANATRLFGGRRLRPGATIEVRITAPGMTGKVVRYRVRAGKVPKSTRLCLPAGARKPARC